MARLRFRQKNSLPLEWRVIRQFKCEMYVVVCVLQGQYYLTYCISSVSIDVHSNRTLVSLKLGATELHTDNHTSYRSLAALRVPFDASSRLEFNSRSVSHCIFIEDGARALCGTADGRLLVYDLDDDQEVIPASQILQYESHEEASGTLQCLAVSISYLHHPALPSDIQYRPPPTSTPVCI